MASTPKTYYCDDCTKVRNDPEARYNCLKTINYDPTCGVLPILTPTILPTMVYEPSPTLAESSPNSTLFIEPSPSPTAPPYDFTFLSRKIMEGVKNFDIYIYPSAKPNVTLDNVNSYINGSIDAVQKAGYVIDLNSLSVNIIMTCDWPILDKFDNNGRFIMGFGLAQYGCAKPVLTPITTQYKP